MDDGLQLWACLWVPEFVLFVLFVHGLILLKIQSSTCLFIFIDRVSQDGRRVANLIRDVHFRNINPI